MTVIRGTHNHRIVHLNDYVSHQNLDKIRKNQTIQKEKNLLEDSMLFPAIMCYKEIV